MTASFSFSFCSSTEGSLPALPLASIGGSFPARSPVCSATDDDDDDDDDGQKDGEYLPKIRSAGLTTGKKRPMLRQRERSVSKRLRFDDSN